MRITMIPLNGLSDEQYHYLKTRVNAPEHLNDKVAKSILEGYEGYGWNDQYVFVRIDELETPMAMATCSGRPCASAAWWVDANFRHQGYGNEMVDLLCKRLKETGAKGFWGITIQTHNDEYDEPSRKLIERILRCFDEDPCR